MLGTGFSDETDMIHVLNKSMIRSGGLTSKEIISVQSDKCCDGGMETCKGHMIQSIEVKMSFLEEVMSKTIPHVIYQSHTKKYIQLHLDPNLGLIYTITSLLSFVLYTMWKTTEHVPFLAFSNIRNNLMNGKLGSDTS